MAKVAYLIGEEDIHAYVDDALGPRRRRAVEACISQDSALAEKVAAYRAQKAELQLRTYLETELPEPIRALCRKLAREITRCARESDEWNKTSSRKVYLSSGR
jgi:anti-sigma factor RsiW